MAEYRIPQEAAHQIAVGLYRQVGEFVAAAKRDHPDDYERFKRDHLEKQSAQTLAAAKRNYTRKRRALFR